LILLVEDNPADANLVRKALEEHNIEGELMVAGDGENAIRLIEELDALSVDCPDLIIVDLSLPKRSGREVLARLRLSARCSRVPIVILTSSDAKKDQVEAARLGVSQYLRKPSRLEDFLNLGGILKAILAGSAR
jgi:DNA-binding response OmpR family regulator